MGKKKNTPKAGGTSLPALKIGSRVRCTDNGVEGRIAWANAVAVKIRWDDGEEITWKRDSLATRPIEILDADAEADQPQILQMPERAEAPELAPEQVAELEPAPAEEQAPPVTVAPAPETVESPVQTWQAALEAARPGPVEEEPDATTTAAETPPQAADQPPAANDAVVVADTAPAKAKRQRKAPAEPKEKKLSAIDAAARVLAETGVAMTCKELIGTMAAKGYWSSPGGKTPDATLNAAILREITVKGEQSRFVKPAPGRFALRPAAPSPA